MTDKEYYELIQPYEDAMKLLLTRLEVLNHSIYKTKTGKPVHNIQYRIKKKDSIEEKLVRHGFEPTLENAKDQLQDIAVEIQLRTISMDFWAAMEHRVSYKKQYDNKEQRVAELLQYSNILEKMEKEFEKYNDHPVEM